MHHVPPKITTYLKETLGECVTPRPWVTEERLPLFLRDRYAFYEGQLFDTQLLFMVARTQDEETPANVRKHIAQLQDKWNHPVVYVREHVTTYNRKRLIEQRVSFIVPGKQMYLPLLGFDLRDRFGTVKTKVKTLSPSTQAILIHTLLHSHEGEALSTATLEPRLHYAPITMSRAFDDLETAKLVTCDSVGRTRQLHLADTKKTIWEKALPLMRSPVKHLHHVLGEARAIQSMVAGLSALAQRSMLAEPNIAIVAISSEDWNSALQHGKITSVSMSEAGTTDVEVWKYPPHLLSDDRIVDPLSLYLTLKDEADERIEIALKNMLKDISW